jgi:hypothetical protein
MAFNMILLFTLNTPVPSTRQIQAGLTPIMEVSISQDENLRAGRLGIFEKRRWHGQ